MVFGRRSGPDESSVQPIFSATGNPWAVLKPPSFDTSASLAKLGQTAKTVTFGLFVYWSPSLIDTPNCRPTGGGAVTTSWLVAVPVSPELSVTRTPTINVCGLS